MYSHHEMTETNFFLVEVIFVMIVFLLYTKAYRLYVCVCVYIYLYVYIHIFIHLCVYIHTVIQLHVILLCTYLPRNLNPSLQTVLRSQVYRAFSSQQQQIVKQYTMTNIISAQFTLSIFCMLAASQCNLQTLTPFILQMWELRCGNIE